MIERSAATTGEGACAVTFTLSADGLNGHGVSVVGDFNDWNPAAAPLRPEADTLAATLVLEPGRRYRFRYLTDRGQWFNDHGADDYADNDFGGQDGVLDLTSAEIPV